MYDYDQQEQQVASRAKPTTANTAAVPTAATEASTAASTPAATAVWQHTEQPQQQHSVYIKIRSESYRGPHMINTLFFVRVENCYIEITQTPTRSPRVSSDALSNIQDLRSCLFFLGKQTPEIGIPTSEHKAVHKSTPRLLPTILHAD